MIRKHARSCAGCRQQVRARYRAMVDEFLCGPCYAGWTTKRTAQQVSVVPSDPAPPPLLPPSADHAEVELFDLSHLVPK